MMLAATVKVEARTLSLDEIKYNVSKQTEIKCAKFTDAEIHVSVSALPFNTITLPDGKVTYDVQLLQDKFLSRALVKVTVYVNGRAEKIFNAPVWVKAYENVLVAKTDISKDQVINLNVVKVEKRDCSAILDYAISGEYLNKDIVAKKYYKAGEIIDKRFVKLRPDVQRNTEIQVYFNTNGLSISISAIAMGEGMVGDYIAVQSRDYKKVYNGKIIGANKVLVNM